MRTIVKKLSYERDFLTTVVLQFFDSGRWDKKCEMVSDVIAFHSVCSTNSKQVLRRLCIVASRGTHSVIVL